MTSYYRFDCILPLSVHLKYDLIREAASHEGDNIVVFYHLNESDIWPNKRDGLWEDRGTTVLC